MDGTSKKVKIKRRDQKLERTGLSKWRPELRLPTLGAVRMPIAGERIAARHRPHAVNS
jgi:hypothetical protein